MTEPQITAWTADRLSQKPTPRFSSARPLQGRGDFAVFYKQYGAALIRFVMRLGATPHEAADAVQTAFAEAFPRWDQITAPQAWLRTVSTRSYLRQTGSREYPTAPLPDRPGDVCPEETVAFKEEAKQVHAALATLPPRQRHVMAWRLDGFTHDEIAAALSMTPAAVRQNYARARAALKRSLGLTSTEER